MCRIVSKLFCGMPSKLEFRVIVRIVPRRNVQSWNLLQVHIRWWYLCFHEYQAREKHKQNRDTHLGKKKEMNDDEICTGAPVSQWHWWFLDDSARTARNIKHAVLYENASFTADITWKKSFASKKWNMTYMHVEFVFLWTFQILSHLHNGTLYNNIDASLIV